MKRIFFTLFLALYFPNVFACLILFITDGKIILVGNHEDWYARDAEVTFVPSQNHKFGMLYFDFASEGSPQGGMNEAGLFFDGTRTPYAPYPDNEKKLDCKCYIWKKILEECSTTEQAISYLNKYKIPEIEDVHILFADRNGNSVIAGVYDGKLQIHRRNGNYQLLTNFNITNPSYGDEPPCKRFATAEKMMHIDSSASISNMENILSKTHQDALTVYSNIYNLTTGEVYVYSKANFTKKATLNLRHELNKGKHSVRIVDLVK
ncbi:MAG: linear amide C-N hydrolase [Bacteroidetes bacterium]|nr:linear amide C-N hydrolase [Bacteroidota bacterium]